MVLPPYYAIEGVIGVGKTTLAHLLHAEHGGQLVLESFDENPFLASFYQDSERYAFQTQVFFLHSRYQQQRAVREVVGEAALVSDYLFDKDRLFARLNLHGAEWDMYCKLYRALAEQIARPDVVLYLRASVDTLMARIQQRGRAYEQDMSRAYITQLAEAYDRYFAGYRDTRLLTIETDDLDLVGSAAARAALFERVRHASRTSTPQNRVAVS